MRIFRVFVKVEKWKDYWAITLVWLLKESDNLAILLVVAHKHHRK